MSSDKGSAVTGVYVLDFSQEKPVSTYKISGDSVLDCKYLTSDTAVLVGSQASYIVKKGEKNYKTVSYEDKTLSNYCFNTDTSTYTMALSRSGDGRSVALISYNSNGEAQYTINTEHKADSLSVYKGTVAILDGNVVYGYNQNGDLLYSTNSGTGSKKIVLASDYTAYILSVNQIRFITLTVYRATIPLKLQNRSNKFGCRYNYYCRVCAFVFIDFKRGIAITILNVAGVALTGFLAYHISNFLASWVYTAFVQQTLTTNLQQMIDTQGINSAIANSFSALPNWVMGMLGFFLSIFGLDSSVYTTIFRFQTLPQRRCQLRWKILFSRLSQECSAWLSV